jgi:hypothetical protein
VARSNGLWRAGSASDCLRAPALATRVPIQVPAPMVGATAQLRQQAAAEAVLQAEAILPAQDVRPRRVRPVQRRSQAPSRCGRSQLPWHRLISATLAKLCDCSQKQLTECRGPPIQPVNDSVQFQAHQRAGRGLRALSSRHRDAPPPGDL